MGERGWVGTMGLSRGVDFSRAIIFVIFGCREEKKNCVYFCTKLYNFILIKCHPEYFENKWNNFGGNGSGNEKFQRDEKFFNNYFGKI